MKIGITSTVPSEVVYAAGHTLLDLNNIYVTAENPLELFEEAEADGFPSTYCGWIKGLYSSAIKENVDTVIAVVEGDCSNTHALMELYSYKNIKTIPFAYPFSRKRENLELNIKNLMEEFGVTENEVEKKREEFVSIREKLVKLDKMTYQDMKVSGFENHVWLVTSSDFNGAPEKYERDLELFLKNAEKRVPETDGVRLGYVGVPPIFTNIYDEIESLGGRIVFNEVQRQFSMPNFKEDLITQYLEYTYPYDIFLRIKDIKREIKERNISGIIHYVQSFCYRSLEDLILRKELNIPVLTIEGDKPVPIDARTRIRLEAFIEMVGKL